MIAHQDTKPSNVLSYRTDGFKIADFGRSSVRGRPAHHDDFKIAGDRSYAPPELLYGFTHADFVPRRIGCDLYMMGNLAAFLYSGVNVTAHLLSHLDKQHHPTVWTGTYSDVLPYLQNAFTRVLEDLKPKIDERVRPGVTALIEELCNPDISRRGHPKGIGRHDQYSLERYVSLLNLAAKRLELRIRIDRQLA
jgi:serine/threonine protein kinase